MPEADYGQGPKIVCDTRGENSAAPSATSNLNQMVIFNLNIEVPMSLGTHGLATNCWEGSKKGSRLLVPSRTQGKALADWSPDIFSLAPGKCSLALARSCCW